jgi:hypothetical protein
LQQFDRQGEIMKALDRLIKIALSKGDSHWPPYLHPLKYCVTFRLTLRGDDEPIEESFSYYDLVTAKRVYRDILLRLYQGQGIVAYAICLNRYGDGVWAWEKAIFREADGWDEQRSLSIQDPFAPQTHNVLLSN